MPRAGRCAFCRKVRRLSEEHVLGKWIKELFVSKGVATEDAYSKLGSVSLTDNVRSEIQYPTVLFEQTVGAVCSSCNNEWMSAMEGRVKHFLSPMIVSGKKTRLTRHDQRHLAAWTLKTLLVFQCMQPEKGTIPDSVFGEFYKTKEPGNNHMVWLGCRGKSTRTGQGVILSRHRK